MRRYRPVWIYTLPQIHSVMLAPSLYLFFYTSGQWIFLPQCEWWVQRHKFGLMGGESYSSLKLNKTKSPGIWVHVNLHVSWDKDPALSKVVACLLFASYSPQWPAENRSSWLRQDISIPGSPGRNTSIIIMASPTSHCFYWIFNAKHPPCTTHYLSCVIYILSNFQQHGKKNKTKSEIKEWNSRSLDY